MANRQNHTIIKIIHRSIATLIAIFITGTSYCQPWKHPPTLKSGTDSANIFQQFETYWQGKPYEKGKGFKQFKRWEYFMQPRMYPNRQTISNTEYAKYYRAYIQPQSRANAYPAWESLGPNALPTNSQTKQETGIGRLNCIRQIPGTNNYLAGSPSGGL